MRIAWNKNLTKETDERVKNYSKKLLGVKKKISEETIKKLRENAKLRIGKLVYPEKLRQNKICFCGCNQEIPLNKSNQYNSNLKYIKGHGYRGTNAIRC
jgi:hypothetical protein